MELTVTADIPNTIYWDIKAVVRLFFIFVLYMLIAGILAGVVLVALNVWQLRSPSVKSLLNLFVYAVTMLITIKYAIRKSEAPKKSPFQLKFNKAQIRLFPVVIISTLALVVILSQVSELIPMPPAVKKFFENAFQKDFFSIVMITIAAPVLEEILCRGIVLKGLLQNYSPYKAILISAIFFGALHLNPWQAAPAFLGGLFLGWTYYKTQSVIPGMVIHAIVNITSTAMLFLSKMQENRVSLFYKHYNIPLCIGGLVIFFVGCITIDRQTNNRGFAEMN